MSNLEKMTGNIRETRCDAIEKKVLGINYYEDLYDSDPKNENPNTRVVFVAPAYATTIKSLSPFLEELRGVDNSRVISFNQTRKKGSIDFNDKDLEKLGIIPLFGTQN
jgi:hypothetical protein